MLLFTLLVLFSSFFSLINADGNDEISVVSYPGNGTCSLNPSYRFIEGHKVTLFTDSTKTINKVWLTHVSPSGSKNSLAKREQAIDKGRQNVTVVTVDKSMEGTWVLQLFNLKDTEQLPQNNLQQLPDGLYFESTCKTNVAIEPMTAPQADKRTNNTTNNSDNSGNKSDTTTLLIIIIAVEGVIALIIIFAQAAYIIYLKSRAKRLNRHNNLSKKMERTPSDAPRYCADPGQKIIKGAPTTEVDRDSVIYEAPNIEMPERVPVAKPPEPPAISTMPRTPRADNNIGLPQTMLASALSSPVRSPVDPPAFPRPKQPELNSNPRPPLPLPPHNHYPDAMEEYEEMDVEENTYEPAPIINTMPPRLAMPPKKVPTAQLIDMKEDTLKLKRIHKPPVTPKPQTRSSNMPQTPAKELEQILRRRNNDTLPKQTEVEKTKRRNNEAKLPTNELEEALRRRNNAIEPKVATNELEQALKRRNNAKHVPVAKSPEPSSTRATPNTRPPHGVQTKQWGAPTPQPVHEEIYNHNSWDEEWTYEPLKPLKTYDKNIYNV